MCAGSTRGPENRDQCAGQSSGAGGSGLGSPRGEAGNRGPALGSSFSRLQEPFGRRLLGVTSLELASRGWKPEQPHTGAGWLSQETAAASSPAVPGLGRQGE
ncbi:hypothetical protein H1C71_010446 [Ictidomys tridecemlineatus]|nr:hypothetical protein H1C71_010446 [Ictidomys tridecemlineatus]